VNNQMVLKRSVLAVALTLTSSHLVLAQTAADAAPQKVIITGSNIKRTSLEGSSSVQTITAKDIAAVGATTVQELLHSIPSFGTGASIDTVDGGFSKGASTASLRGLGSSSTLILLNGRRISASAYADPNDGQSTVYDLNNIPVSVIEKVEILLDGASAVYGSDAIAGVINFITKKTFKGLELSGSYRGNDDNEFNRKTVTGTFGFGDLATQNYNFFATAELSERDSTGIKDVKDVQLAQLAHVNYRLNALSSRESDQPIFYRETSPGGGRFSNTRTRQSGIIAQTSGCAPGNIITGNAELSNLTPNSALNGLTFCNFDTNDYSEAQAAGKDANVLGVFTYNFGPNLTSFTEFGYNRSERTYLGAPRSFRSTSSTTVFALSGAPQQFQVILPIGHPDNPFANARSAVSYRFTNTQGGSDNTNESYRIVTGLKGSVGQWDWETAFLWNRVERTEHLNGLLYRPTLDLINTQNRTLAQTAADPTATYRTEEQGFAQVTQLDAKASTEFGKLPGGKFGLAFGGEIREDKIGLTPDAATQRGDIVGLSNSTADGQRTVSAAFIELTAPLLKTLEVDLAARYDKYPNLSGSTTPKIGAKWTPNNIIAFRGTYSEGFRAPALTQVSPGGVQFFDTVSDAVRCPDGNNPVPGAEDADCSKSISGSSAANPTLKPETAKSYTFGIILAPTKDLDILIDWYRIRKIDETTLLSSQFVVDHSADYPGAVIRDTNVANLLTDANGNPIPGTGPIFQVGNAYINQGSTEVRGIDFQFAFRKNLGEYGKLSSQFDLNYVLAYKNAVRPGDREANVAGANGGLSDFAIAVGDIPRVRAQFSLTWTKGNHDLTGTASFVDSVSLLRRTNNSEIYPVPYCHYGRGQPEDAFQIDDLPRFSDYTSDCEVRSWTTFGLNYRYSGFKNSTLNLNIQNIFDTAAPYDPRSTYTNRGFNSDLHNGQGRTFRLTYAYKFK
jgi:iron complex outermembrane receptor protein